MLVVTTPIGPEVAAGLEVGGQIELHGPIFCGRDAVLPRLAALAEAGRLDSLGLDLRGAVIFHTAVSPAGIGPTTSNKVEIEDSIPALSQAGVRLHLGKGSLKPATVAALERHGSVFAVTPPVSALFGRRTVSTRIAAFAEEGMEALWEVVVAGLPAIVAIAQGRNIFDRPGRGA